MIKLNLEAKNTQLQNIKEYLENNASEILADKINNGVKIVKENKTLINKKDLIGFWKFAMKEARKQAVKGDNGAWIEDSTVYGWAIHYFEEDSIEGKLLNEDGTEYKAETKQVPKPVKIEQPKKPENTQGSLFELMSSTISTPKEEQSKIVLTEEQKRILRDVFDEEIDEEPIIENLENNDEDLENITEEIKTETNEQKGKTLLFDIGIIKIFNELLDGKLEVR